MRSIRRRIDRAPALAAAIALAAIACNTPLEAPIPTAHPGDETPRRGGVLRLASFGDIRALDPAVASDALSSAAIESIFAGLVDFDGSANIAPDLARHFEVADDGLTYRFFLREGILFQDGVELEAQDIKRSIERALHPSTPNPIATSFDTIVGFREYADGKADHLAGVQVEGKYVVSIRVRQRDARFLPVLALQALRPVCRSAGDRYVDNWSPCGAGPFKVLPGGWDRGRSLTLVRHEGYYKPGQPYLDSIVWTYGINVTAERFKFEDGELDEIKDLSVAEVIRFQSDPRWKPLGEYEPDRNVSGEVMNAEMPPFDNVEVRRAVAAAIDREHYRLARPINGVATQVIPAAVPGYDPTFEGQRYDYRAALEHMRRAGYPYDPSTGQGGYPAPIAYYAYSQGVSVYMSQVLAQELAKIGLRLEIHTVNYPTFLALAYRRKGAPMSAPGWAMDYPDASDFFEPLFSSGAISDDNSTNMSFYSNPRLDALLDRARGELDRDVRYRLYGEANRIVCDDAPWAFTHVVRYYVQRQPYVHGFPTHPVWATYPNDAWIDRASPSKLAGRELTFGAWASLLGVRR